MNQRTQLFAGLVVAVLVAACNKAPSTPEAEPAITPAPATPAPTTTPDMPPSTPSTSPDAGAMPSDPAPSPGSMPPAQQGGGSN